jgi:RNA polymerase sigma-70 factor (ECF subfamily)
VTAEEGATVDEADQAMDQYAAGDDAAFERVYDCLCPRLSRYLERNVADRGVAAELLQDTFEHLIRARGRFRRGARVVPWVYAIARNLFLEHLRGAARQRARLGVPVREELPCAAASPEELAQAGDLARRLEERLHTLPEAHRHAFELLRLEGLSLKETAAALGATVMAIKLRHHRARRALADLAGEEP